MLKINPEYLCVDGSQIRKRHSLVDPYKKQILILLDQGFGTTQILGRLQSMYPDINIKRSTLSDYCIKLRAEMYEYVQSSMSCGTVTNGNSIINPHTDKIRSMLEDNRTIKEIHAAINSDGYAGSYSLLQQYCNPIKPLTYRTKKATSKIKRKDMVSAIWSEKTDLTAEDISYIKAQYPVFIEIKDIILEFRTSYSKKDVDAVKAWCEKYALCKFPAICSFINGINDDAVAFYNSMKYEYNNGLLEGFVNKLKAVKRTMYGRASYVLLRAKLLLGNDL